MVDFVMTQSSAPRTRLQVIQMWQALLTEGVIEHGECMCDAWIVTCIVNTCDRIRKGCGIWHCLDVSKGIILGMFIFSSGIRK